MFHAGVITLFFGVLATGPQQPTDSSLVGQALEKPAETEAFARKMQAADPSSATWVILLAKSQAAQGRCSEAARGLVAARQRVEASGQLLLGMSMTQLVLQCEGLPLADARPLLEAAEAIATTELKSDPENRDVVMLQGAALTALAQRLPPGPERSALEARGSASFDRFLDLHPDRKRALAGEPPADLARAFDFVREFLDQGRNVEAARLYANTQKVHGGSPTFRAQAATHHARLAGSHLDRASTEPPLPTAQRLAALQAGQAEIDRAFAFDPASKDAMMYGALILRAQADLEPDPSRKAVLLKDAAAWLDKAGMTPPPPPPPPPARPPGPRAPI